MVPSDTTAPGRSTWLRCESKKEACSSGLSCAVEECNPSRTCALRPLCANLRAMLPPVSAAVASLAVAGRTDNEKIKAAHTFLFSFLFSLVNFVPQLFWKKFSYLLNWFWEFFLY